MYANINFGKFIVLTLETKTTDRVEELYAAGVHLGHPRRFWHPTMEKFIFGNLYGKDIIDLTKTIECLDVTCEFLMKEARKNGQFLIVGTKKQAQNVVKQEALKIGSFYVDKRWLGGTLTNFTVIETRLKNLLRMREYGSRDDKSFLTKRERLKMQVEIEKLDKMFGGILEMKRIPDVAIIIDTKTEYIAVKEANLLHIPIIGLVDTNCDTSGIDYPIPGNDDSIKSIKIILEKLIDAIALGMSEKNIIQTKVVENDDSNEILPIPSEGE